MIIIINTLTGIIEIKKTEIIENEETEKDDNIKTAPIDHHPIQYNETNYKRKYYTKEDKEYKRSLNGQSIQRQQAGINQASKTSKFDKIVKQEPLLDFHY